jgi:hypothetical protein
MREPMVGPAAGGMQWLRRSGCLQVRAADCGRLGSRRIEAARGAGCDLRTLPLPKLEASQLDGWS